jgi:hypothetical protein
MGLKKKFLTSQVHSIKLKLLKDDLKDFTLSDEISEKILVLMFLVNLQ